MRQHRRGVALQHRHDLGGEQPHVELGLLVGHAAEAELGDEMVDAGEPSQLGDLPIPATFQQAALQGLSVRSRVAFFQ